MICVVIIPLQNNTCVENAGKRLFQIWGPTSPQNTVQNYYHCKPRKEVTEKN